MGKVNETVVRLFVSTDQRDWNAVQQCFASKVELDYSSMNGNPAAVLSPADIISAWKSVLPGFEFTHHQLGNFISQIDGSKAHVFCYGTATHYLKNEGGNVWTVVGSYDFDLVQESNQWKISRMKFNFKYQDGNTTLAEKAIKRLKK
ncbi:MAG TPA: nuclear transport factor 2 family protein [Bacteroidales bacterium]|nr:nuclear transport factor 2 family protein [Bacteroidales bacterium]